MDDKNLPSTKFDLHEILKIDEIFLENPQTFLVFVLQCIQGENVHNCPESLVWYISYNFDKLCSFLLAI